MTLRPYQAKLSDRVNVALNECDAVLATMATGGGKTHLLSHHAQLAERDGPTVLQAHRQELVYQLSMALARDGIYHRILAPDAVCRYIIERQIDQFNRKYVHHEAVHTVASVDTLLSRAGQLGNWVDQVRFVQTDEGHHCLPDNKWGRALNLFPRAKRLAWTATPGRADRKPLAGCFKQLVLGPTTAELLALGALCPYRIYGPPPSIDTTGITVTGGGDFSPDQLRKAAHRSTVTGDMVSHYLKLIPGAVGIAFLVDVEQAKETAERFNAAGVRAVWMSSRETDDRTRVGNLEALARGDIKLICNVDLLGEGVDVPRVEVVLDGRPTESLSRYLQVFGRLLRTYPGKSHGTYVDLVGNVVRHGPPDARREWTLEVPERRKRTPNDEEGLKACPSCYGVYRRFLAACPSCGWKPVPAGRSRPEEVDGDLTEYAPELLAKLRGEADAIMAPAPVGVASYVQRNWDARVWAQSQLRSTMAVWAGVQQARGLDDASTYRLFWHRYGIDTLTAQQLGRTQAAELDAKLWEDINNDCPRPRQPVPVMVPDLDEVWLRGPNSRPPRKGGKYRLQIKHNGKLIYLGMFHTKEECDQVEKEYREQNGLPPKRIQVSKGYGRKYQLQIKHDEKVIHLGRFRTKEECDQVEKEYREQNGLPPKRIRTPRGRGGKFKGEVRYNGKLIYLGQFHTKEEVEAARAKFREVNGNGRADT